MTFVGQRGVKLIVQIYSSQYQYFSILFYFIYKKTQNCNEYENCWAKVKFMGFFKIEIF